MKNGQIPDFKPDAKSSADDPALRALYEPGYPLKAWQKIGVAVIFAFFCYTLLFLGMNLIAAFARDDVNWGAVLLFAPFVLMSGLFVFAGVKKLKSPPGRRQKK